MNPDWVTAINLRDIDMLYKSITRETVNEFNTVHFAEWSPLQFAASRGDATSVDFLLKLGADPNLNDGRGWRALHLAASSCSGECVRLLLEAGADIRVMNQRGRTALCCAIECCNVSSTRLLIEHGAKTENCCVRVPAWVRELEEGRDRCRYVALMLVGIRRFRRSPVLATNPVDIAKLLGKAVWSLRMDENWQYENQHDQKKNGIIS